MRHTRGLALMAAAVAGLGMMAEPPRNRVEVREARHRKRASLNRSNKWPYAATYKEAREKSPFPERPIR
jgi:hypothetical protein